ncbi:MAG: HDOD domain-containing protein [Burkholderiaceae bacterium]
MPEHQLKTVLPATAADLVRSINIPPRPALLMALQHEMRRAEPHLKKVAQLLGRDAAMAGNLLQSANSAYLGVRRRVETVEDAVVLLGMDQCGAVMTALIARRALANGRMMMARFWDVSEKRSRGMSHVAAQTHSVAPELAHSFGLFCDIGIPLLKAHFPSYLETLAIANRAEAGNFVEIENSRHGIDHTVVGALLAENWGMSPEVVRAIRLHHAPDALYDEAIPVAVRALVAANLIVEKAIQDFRGEPESREWREGGHVAVEALGLNASVLAELNTELQHRFAIRNAD